MRRGRRVIAFRCSPDEGFWSYAERQGFQVAFADSEGDLLQALASGEWDAVVATDGRAWTEAALLISEHRLNDRLPVVLLPHGPRRVRVSDPDAFEEVQPVHSHYQLVQMLDEACGSGKREKLESDGRDEAEKQGLETLSGRLQAAVQADFEDVVWLDHLRDDVGAALAGLGVKEPESA